MKKRVSRTREPSKASLREIPEVDFEHVRVRRNPYAARIAAEGIHVSRGRPTKGTETGPTVPRSVRFPPKLWKELEAKAKARGMSLHSALRAAILQWAKRAP
jgi:Ribbon-helix-helix protein, copG family